MFVKMTTEVWTSNVFLNPIDDSFFSSSFSDKGVNFTNILWSAFVPIFLRKKVQTYVKYKYKNAAQNTFVRKSRA